MAGTDIEPEIKMIAMRKRDILLWSSAIIIMMYALSIFFLGDRIAFYWNTRNLPPSPLAIFEAGIAQIAKLNVDFGFISFHLELSPEATFKKSDSTVTIKDQGRTLAINLPEIFSEMQVNPEHPDDLQDFDRLVEKYGNIVRAQKAAYEFQSNVSVVFCAENDFKCYTSLVRMKLVPLPIYEKQEYHTTPTYDAIIDTIHGKSSKTFSITWTTNQGKRVDQRRGVIMMSEKLPTQDTSWASRFIHSIIIDPKGKIISLDEMVTRLEKLKSSTFKDSR